MSYLESIIMGVFQGLTEFLPISSSGHLVILQKLMGVTEANLLLGVAFHLGTLISVFAVFWNDIKGIVNWLLNIFSHNKSEDSAEYLCLVKNIIVASIPTAFIGFTFKPYFERLFTSTLSVGIMLMITGAMLWISDRLVHGNKRFCSMGIIDSLFIGFFQGLAITPGISRSGSTIFASLIRGLPRERAVRFSFLLSIPAVGGAALLELKDVFEAGILTVPTGSLLIGIVSAAMSGVIVIRFLVSILNKGQLHYFAFYCWILGLSTILFLGR